LKYKDLQIKIQRMWNIRTKVLPITTGVTGLISNVTSNVIKETPGKYNLLQMQKTVVLSTAHTLYNTKRCIKIKSNTLGERCY